MAAGGGNTPAASGFEDRFPRRARTDGGNLMRVADNAASARNLLDSTCGIDHAGPEG